MGRFLSLTLGCVVGVAALSSLPFARADESPGEPPLWVFDLQVVQTTCDANSGLAASPWEGAAGPAHDLTFESALETLKKRGKIFLLLNQRVTSLENVECHMKQETSNPTERLVNKSRSNETHQFASVPTGCRAELRMVDDHLAYHIEARWPLWPIRREGAVPHAQVSWTGTHPPLDGKTLVLHYRDHNLQEEGEPQISEIYCFLTARKTAR